MEGLIKTALLHLRGYETQTFGFNLCGIKSVDNTKLLGIAVTGQN